MLLFGFVHMHKPIRHNARTFAVASLSSLKKGTSNSIQITNSHFSGEERERLDRTGRTSAEGNCRAQGKEADCFFKARSPRADGRAGS